MCASLQVHTLFSGQLSSRNFLSHPPEPSPSLLLSSPANSIYLGKTRGLHVPFFWDPQKLLNPHVCVVGMTGSGKSYLVKTLVTRARRAIGANCLILDWAGEYSKWVMDAGGTTINFGTGGINLLELSESTPHNRCQQVLCALDILTNLSSRQKERRAISLAIMRAYGKKGLAAHLPVHSQKGRKLPTLEDVRRELAIMAKKDENALLAHERISSLLLSSSHSFTKQTIPLSSLTNSFTCVDLHSLPTEELRSMAGLSILQLVKEKMRASSHQNSPFPRLLIVVDEAWKVAADERSDVISIVREGRKYGFALIVASQSLTDVNKAIFANAGTIFAFRLSLASEREYLRSSIAYSEHFEREFHRLAVGQPMVHIIPLQPVSGSKTFILEKVEGEAAIQSLHLRGGNMDLQFERASLARALVWAGLTDAQSSRILAEFERNSGAISSTAFASLLEKAGLGKAPIIRLLRELGANEKEILSTFSPPRPRKTTLQVKLRKAKVAHGGR